MHRRDLLKRHEKHLLLHDYDYDGSFIDHINALVDNLDELLLLREGDRERVFDEIVSWIKDYLKSFKHADEILVEVGSDPSEYITIPIDDEYGYEPGANNLMVYYNGTVLYRDKNYTESEDGKSITLKFTPREGDQILIRIKQPLYLTDTEDESSLSSVIRSINAELQSIRQDMQTLNNNMIDLSTRVVYKNEIAAQGA